MVFLSQVVPDYGPAFGPLRTAITEKFWPALFEDTLSDAKKSLFFLPVRLGCIGIRDPVDLALNSFYISCSFSEEIISVIKGKSDFFMWSHLKRLYEVCTAFCHSLQLHYSEILKPTLDLLTPYQHRAVSCSIEGRTFGWLSALPIVHHHFDLSSVEFCNALAFGYH